MARHLDLEVTSTEFILVGRLIAQNMDPVVLRLDHFLALQIYNLSVLSQ